MSSNPTKDTIYIDVEDEIAAIIDKIRSSNAKVLALVPPKNATVLKSVVNMKLLKKSAESAKKHIVLVTQDEHIMPIAGSVGIHVARDLRSKPHIPEVEESTSEEATIDETETIAISPDTDKSSLDTDGDSSKAGDKNTDITNPKKLSINKKLKIPNFDHFRNRTFLGVLGVLLLVGLWILAFKVMPKATITVTAQTTEVSTDLNAIFSALAKEDNFTDKILVAEYKETKKNNIESFTATGTKDTSAKAKGSVTIVNCTNADVTVPAGTAFSAGDKNFFNSQAIIVVASTFQYGACKNDGTAVATLTAQNTGEAYNVGPQTYLVAGVPSGVTASGEAMTGGSSKIVKVVSQSDVDAARTKATTQDSQAMLAELKKQFAGDMYVINDSFLADAPSPTVVPAVGEEAPDGTGKVTAQFIYSVLAVKRSSLVKLLEDYQKTKIDTTKQSILKNGIDDLIFKLVDKRKNNEMVFQIKTTGIAGPELDKQAIAELVQGMRSGDAMNHIKSKADVSDVRVKISPFWITSIPKPQKTTVNISIEGQK